MAYSLSFSPEFFFAEGEPYDRGPYTEAELRRPTSVYMAIHAMGAEQWADMARELFDCKPEHLTPEAVLVRIEATDTCSNLDSPVAVWIDDAGDYRVFVYEER